MLFIINIIGLFIVSATSILGAVSDGMRIGGQGKLVIDKEEVLENAQTLCKLLAREFIFAPVSKDPCLAVDNSLTFLALC